MNQKLSKTVLIILIITLSTFGCSPNNLYMIVMSDYKAKSLREFHDYEGDGVTYSYFGGQYLGIVTKDTVRNKKVIFGRFLGHIYGHRFEFDKQNILNRYMFDVDGGKHFSYGIEVLGGQQYTETGNPYVDYWRDKSYSSKDSTRYIFLFSKFPRKQVQVLFSYDSVSFKSLKLENSQVMPYLVEGKLILPNVFKVIYFKIEADQFLFPINGLQEKAIFSEKENL